MRKDEISNEKAACEYISQMMQFPICIFDGKGNIEEEYCKLIKEWKRVYRSKEFINSLLRLRNKKYPVIRIDEYGIFYTVLYSEKTKNIFLVGPVIVGTYAQQNIIKLKEKYNIDKDHDGNLSIYSLTEYLAGIKLLFMLLTDKQISDDEIWEYNKNTYQSVRNIKKSISQEFFSRNENFGKHNPYEQELREMESIENGDEEALKRSIAEVYEGQIGILAKNPLRHHQNVAIGNVTLASRAAIKGGIDEETSFSMADVFIRQIEEMTSISEIEEYKNEVKIIYAQNVKKEKERGREEKNPLIRDVKNYIFTHMHEAIKISEAAENFKVNPDYLSHIFSKHEKMTFSQYVMNEKVKRSQNLLKYSDYKIQEIGFYLGFSSQSHFTKVFKDITGMKPSEYRKKYGHRVEWNSKK